MRKISEVNDNARDRRNRLGIRCTEMGSGSGSFEAALHVTPCSSVPLVRWGPLDSELGVGSMLHKWTILTRVAPAIMELVDAQPSLSTASNRTPHVATA